MRFRAALITLVLAVLAGCGKPEGKEQSETATSGSFELVADETLKPVIDSLVNGFMSESPEAHVTVRYVSAAEAILELLNKKARAVIVARGLNSAERLVLSQDSTTLPELAIAEDGIACIVSRSNGLAAMRQSDLRKIVRGEMARWDLLQKPIVEPGAKPAGAITMVFPEYPSSTEFIMDSMYIGPVNPNAKVSDGERRRFHSSDSVIAYVRSHSNAIGFIGSAWKHRLEASGDSGIAVLPIIPADSSSHGLTEPIMLHIAYIYEKLYPLVTSVTGLSFEVPNTVPRGLLSYAMTAHGQMVFKNFDILPKTQIIRLVPGKE